MLRNIPHLGNPLTPPAQPPCFGLWVWGMLVLVWVPHLSAAELYSQLDAAAPLGTGTAGSFFSDADGADMMAADDFVVPEGETWKIAAIRIGGPGCDCRTTAGRTGEGCQDPLPGYRVVFYQDQEGIPGAVIASQSDLPVTQASGSPPDYFEDVNLHEVVSLRPGHYWLGFQIHVRDCCLCGVGLSTSQHLHPYMWRSNQDSGCEVWSAGMDCDVMYNLSAWPDLRFALFDLPLAAAVPAMAFPWRFTLILLLCAVGWTLRNRDA